eukprot:jgi/Mesvir1/12002/Mv00306-RA.2
MGVASKCSCVLLIPTPPVLMCPKITVTTALRLFLYSLPYHFLGRMLFFSSANMLLLSYCALVLITKRMESIVLSSFSFVHSFSLPGSQGRDFAGTVVDGPAAWVGADVWGSAPKMGFTQDGSHAQFCLVPLDCIAHLPGGLSYSQGAALGVPFGTAYAGLAAASIKPGDIVVVAGMGGVGAAALQLAKWKGAFVVGMGRGPKPSPVAPPLDGYISTSVAEPLAELTAMTPGGRGADIVFNTVGPLVFEKTLSMLAPGGRQIEISANPANPHVQLNVLDFYRRGLRLIGINTLTLTEKDYNAALQDITAGFAAKALTAPAVVEMPLSDVLGAYKAMESGGVKEKIILLP